MNKSRDEIEYRGVRVEMQGGSAVFIIAGKTYKCKDFSEAMDKIDGLLNKSQTEKSDLRSFSVWYYDDEGARKCSVFADLIEAEAFGRIVTTLGFKDVSIVKSMEKAEQFKAGDKVKIKDYMQPDGGKTGKVLYVNSGGGVKVEFTDGQSDTFGADELIKKSVQKFDSKGNVTVGDMVPVPYHPGLKGKITKVFGSGSDKVVEIQYTATSGIVRQERWNEDEIGKSIDKANEVQDLEDYANGDLIDNIKNAQIKRQKATITLRSKEMTKSFKEFWKEKAQDNSDMEKATELTAEAEKKWARMNRQQRVALLRQTGSHQDDWELTLSQMGGSQQDALEDALTR
jgi:hypothetical protein